MGHLDHVAFAQIAQFYRVAAEGDFAFRVDKIGRQFAPPADYVDRFGVVMHRLNHTLLTQNAIGADADHAGVGSDADHVAGAKIGRLEQFCVDETAAVDRDFAFRRERKRQQSRIVVGTDRDGHLSIIRVEIADHAVDCDHPLDRQLGRFAPRFATDVMDRDPIVGQQIGQRDGPAVDLIQPIERDF